MLLFLLTVVYLLNQLLITRMVFLRDPLHNKLVHVIMLLPFCCALQHKSEAADQFLNIVTARQTQSYQGNFTALAFSPI